MVARVARVAIAFDPDYNLRVTPQPRGLRGQHGLGRSAEDDAVAPEIDGGAARLRGKVGAQRVDALQYLRRRLVRSEERKLRRRRTRGDREGEEKNGLAHQSITPDQSGSEPSCGIVICFGLLPSRVTRWRLERPPSPTRWNRISRPLGDQLGPSSPGPVGRGFSPEPSGLTMPIRRPSSPRWAKAIQSPSGLHSGAAYQPPPKLIRL